MAHGSMGEGPRRKAAVLRVRLRRSSSSSSKA
eukprot:CAMPEP_0198708914 /NCGR_PEP_ID=MMETSP1471-20131121/1419_1 /TAXON_ID=41880 /ORGANISM="Pycnococcus provasolii, Strain RCC733" /LENGTH=31 /DNA_ID= /DNA_START= /DNA_END= /DNA_ORIENTATION=